MTRETVESSSLELYEWPFDTKPRLSPQKRPMVITSKPATGQMFGTTFSTPTVMTKATKVSVSWVKMRIDLSGGQGNAGKRPERRLRGQDRSGVIARCPVLFLSASGLA